MHRWCVPLRGPAESFPPHCMAPASRSAAETAGPLERWFPSKRGPGLKDTMPDSSVADSCWDPLGWRRCLSLWLLPCPFSLRGKGGSPCSRCKVATGARALVCCTADVPRRVCPYLWLCIVLWCWQDVSLVWMPGTVQTVPAGRDVTLGALGGCACDVCVSCEGI